MTGVGTSLGVPGAIVPLVITAAPFVACVVARSLASGRKSGGGPRKRCQQSADRVQSAAVRKPCRRWCAGARADVHHLFGFLRRKMASSRRRFGDIAIRYGWRYQYDVMTVAVILSSSSCRSFADHRRPWRPPSTPSYGAKPTLSCAYIQGIESPESIVFGSDSCMRKHCYVVRLLVEFNNSIYDITCFCSAFPRLDGR